MGAWTLGNGAGAHTPGSSVTAPFLRLTAYGVGKQILVLKHEEGLTKPQTLNILKPFRFGTAVKEDHVSKLKKVEGVLRTLVKRCG